MSESIREVYILDAVRIHTETVWVAECGNV